MAGGYANEGKAVTVVLDPRLDAEGAAALRPIMERLAANGEERVLLDFSSVSFMDGAGFGAVAYLLKRLGGRARLVGASGQPLALLRHLGLDRVLGLETSRRRNWASFLRPAQGELAWAAGSA